MKTIAESFEKYEQDVLRNHPMYPFPEKMVHALRIAFYAGFACMLASDLSDEDRELLVSEVWEQVLEQIEILDTKRT